ncbi:hypothetical protein BaRGS_00009472 [Batillaria attramentaria]|uniref:Uncharacterized protein n=1 Tax=Batillaria attramentaria TaxID=370345 RepID=A0ABD0LJN9_9CAEN
MAGVACVGIMWAVLSLLAALAAASGFLLPYWLQSSHPHQPVYLGTFRRCNYPRQAADGEVLVVTECGRYTHFTDIPSLYWQLTTITVGTGSALALLVALTGVVATCVRGVLTHATARLAAILQVCAGALVCGGVAVYPLGWGDREVQQVCGETAAPFEPGTCRVWWGLYLTGVAGVVNTLCAVLTCCAPHKPRYHSPPDFNSE